MKSYVKTLSIPIFILLCVILLSVGLNAKLLPESGNVNLDEKIDGRDVTALLKYLADWDVKADSDFADVNSDGKIRGNDATLLLKKLAGWDVELHSVREYYNFLDYSDEIKTDASVNISALLQACVDEHDNVFIPDGEYLICNPVMLHDNSGILGDDGTLFHTNGNNIFYCRGTDNGDEPATRVQNVKVRHFSATTEAVRRRSFAVSAYSVDGLIVDDLHCISLGIADISTIKTSINVEVKEDCSHFRYLSEHVTITNCYADGRNKNITLADSNMWTDPVGIQLTWLANFTVDGNEIENFYHGIQFVGGNPQIEEYEQTGRFGWGTISNNVVHDVAGGAIWGTMAKYLTVCYNTVYNTDDVGIDFEGGDMCVVEYNTAYNCFHNFALFDPCIGHIEFRNNYSYFTDNASGHCTHFNFKPHKTETYAHQEFIFENNVFEGKDHLTVLGAGYYMNPVCGKFIFKNNTCINTVLATNYYPHCFIPEYDITDLSNVWIFEITDNTFDFTLDDMTFQLPAMDSIYTSVINLLANTTTDGTEYSYKINGNKITAKKGLLMGIFIAHGKNALDYRVECNGNEVSGAFEAGIVIDNETNSVLNVELKNNTAEDITLIGYNFRLEEENNRNSDGSSISAQ